MVLPIREQPTKRQSPKPQFHDTPCDASSSSSSDESTMRCDKANRNRRSRNRKARSSTKGKGNKGKISGPSKEEQSQYLALDCEMVGVGQDGLDSALARVTLVDWDGHIVYDEFVRPSQPVVDYRTFVSGITAEQLEMGVELSQVQSLVAQLIEGRTLVGHALKNDLHALGITHPWQQTRDTAKYEPFMKLRADGRAFPRKLKDLCSEVLGREIQDYGRPHCPVEDAVAAMDLYKTVRSKWEPIMDYKIKKTAQIIMQQQHQQCAATMSVE